MRASFLLAVVLLAAPSVASAQLARELASPWQPGDGGEALDVHPDDGSGTGAPSPRTTPGTPAPGAGGTVEPPQDIHAEGAAGLGSGAAVVVPDGYSTAVIPSPGVYPGVTPRVSAGSMLDLPAGIVTRLRALDSDFTVLAARGGGSVLDGVLALAFGAVAIGVGIAFEPSVSGLRAGGISPYLYTYGGGMVARGILDLVLLTNPSDAALTYGNMPMRSYREARDRLHYGEQQLGHLSEMAALSRYIGGGLNIGLGLLVIPVYIAPNGFHEEDPGAYIMLLGAAVSVTTGLISIFATSEAERRWSAYHDLRDRLATTTAGDDDAELDREVELEEGARAALEPTIDASVGAGSFRLSGTF